MGDRVFLHVGSPKSGTTYLQTLLWANRGRLRDQGTLVPGKKLFEHNQVSIAVRNMGRPDSRPGPVWERFVRRCHDFAGDVIVTNEWLVLANPAQRAQMIRELGPERVHVVVTARNFVRVVPAGWQETLKLGTGRDLTEFVAGLDGPDGRWTWQALDPAEIVAAWSEHVPAERVHVVTVPDAGVSRRELLHRFADATGFDPSGIDEAAATPNESLGVQSAAWLQHAGPSLLESVDAANSPWRDTYRWLRRYLSHRLLVPMGGDPIAIRDDLVEALNERAARSVSRLVESGCSIHGELSDLLEGTNKPGSRLPTDVVPDELHRVGIAVASALLRDRRAQDRQSGAPADDASASEQLSD